MPSATASSVASRAACRTDALLCRCPRSKATAAAGKPRKPSSTSTARSFAAELGVLLNAGVALRAGHHAAAIYNFVPELVPSQMSVLFIEAPHAQKTIFTPRSPCGGLLQIQTRSPPNRKEPAANGRPRCAAICFTIGAPEYASAARRLCLRVDKMAQGRRHTQPA